MTVTIAANSVPKPPADIVEGFRNAPTSIISDNLARLPGAVGLKPYHRSGRLIGARGPLSGRLREVLIKQGREFAFGDAKGFRSCHRFDMYTSRQPALAAGSAVP